MTNLEASIPSTVNVVVSLSISEAIAVKTDVTDTSQLEALADAAVDTFGSLSIW